MAASAVILSHAFVLTGGWDSLKAEPFVALLGITASEIGVNVFFLISGFLVSISAIRRRTILHFAVARVLRIYPALIVVVSLSAFVLGPLISKLAPDAYFTTRSVYGYVGWNAVLLFPLKMRFELPGVFEGLPYPSVVNGSLWTLPWELWMYICTGALAVAGLLRRRILVPLSVFLLALHVAVLIGAVPMPVVLCYLTFFLAMYPPLIVRHWSAGPDFSYGIYLYAYPVQQFLVMSGFPPDPYLNSLATLALTMPLAAGSWYVVEAPALQLKARCDKLIERCLGLAPNAV